MTFQEFNPEFERLSFKSMKKPSQGIAFAYFEKLKHLDMTQLRQAVDFFVTDGTAFPTAQMIMEWLHRNGVSQKGRDGWSFECKACGYSFHAHVENLTSDRYFKCDSCDLYFSRKLTWNGEYLRKKMEESKSLKQTYSEL